MFDADALLCLLEVLDARGYDFVAPTPATHERFLKKRSHVRDGDLRDVFGWSLPFREVSPDLQRLMDGAGIVGPAGEGLKRSLVRVSRVHGRLFLHSAFPTDDKDSVFLGPDSYRFADFIRREMGEGVQRLADIGTGAGVGGLVAAMNAPDAKVFLTDVNPRALELARVNARHAGVEISAVLGEGLDGVPPGLDLVVGNPPYMVDSEGRDYRDGGGSHGADLSVDWARCGLDKLGNGGRMLPYSDRITLIHIGAPGALTRKERADLASEGVALIEAAVERLVLNPEQEQALHFGPERIERFDVVYSALGVTPRARLAVQAGVALDDSGRLIVDDHQMTSVRGLYAAGDVVRGLNQISTAEGEAAQAATAMHNRLRGL